MRFALGLGGNRGGAHLVEATLIAALRTLQAHLGPLEVASLFRTRPVPPLPQTASPAAPPPDFLNTAAIGHTALSPDAILALAKAAEWAAGRRRAPRGAPRPLDIDLLLYGDTVRETSELRLPHPELHRRSFALAPLAQIAPQWTLSPEGPTVADALDALTARGSDEEIQNIGWGQGQARGRGQEPGRRQGR